MSTKNWEKWLHNGNHIDWTDNHIIHSRRLSELDFRYRFLKNSSFLDIHITHGVHRCTRYAPRSGFKTPAVEKESRETDWKYQSFLENLHSLENHILNAGKSHSDGLQEEVDYVTLQSRLPAILLMSASQRKADVHLQRWRKLRNEKEKIGKLKKRRKQKRIR